MKRYPFLILLIIPFVSYSQQNSIKLENFQILPCGLYLNEKGDIGFKTSHLVDDMGHWEMGYQTYGYLVDENISYEDHIVELKNIVDTSSFQILNHYYCKDKNYIYAIFYTSGGATFNITRKIDIHTFKAIDSSSYGLDKRHVYFRTQKVKKADRNTFKSIEEDSYGAYDKYNYYNYGEILTIDEAKKRGYIKNGK
jgi:hypothetical protein